MLIRGLGCVQDPGLVGNSPDLGFSEFRALHTLQSIPQFVISIGTGSSQPLKTQQKKDKSFWKSAHIGRALQAYCDRRARKWVNHFIPRLAKGYLTMLKGAWTWQAIARTFTKVLPVGDRCFRLDIDLGNPEPRLDDAEALPYIKDTLARDEVLGSTIDEAICYIIASKFYMELQEPPLKQGPDFRGLARLRCLYRAKNPDLATFINKLASRRARFVLNGEVIPYDIRDSEAFWDKTGNFSALLSFKTSGSLLSISLRLEQAEYPISGSPFPVEALLQAQGVDRASSMPTTTHDPALTKSANSVLKIVNDGRRKKKCILRKARNLLR